MTKAKSAALDFDRAVMADYMSGASRVLGSTYHPASYLERGAKIDAFDRYGETALTTCARFPFDKRMQENVDTLLKHGANIDCANRAGMTALMLAAQNAGREMVDMLLRNGADPNVTTRDGRTALMMTNDRAIISTLLRNGAKPDTCDASGYRASDYIKTLFTPADYDSMVTKGVLNGAARRGILNFKRGIGMRG